MLTQKNDSPTDLVTHLKQSERGCAAVASMLPFIDAYLDLDGVNRYAVLQLLDLADGGSAGSVLDALRDHGRDAQ